jgi:auxin influx carrier (AUX1 LAX family)
MKRLLWHGGGSGYDDAWFRAASNQVRATFLSVCVSPSMFLLYSELRLASATLQLERSEHDGSCVYLENIVATHSFSAVIWNVVGFVCYSGLRSWMGLLGPYWKAAGLTFNCTFLLFDAVIFSSLHVPGELNAHSTRKPQLSVCPIFWVVSAAEADDGSGDF